MISSILRTHHDMTTPQLRKSISLHGNTTQKDVHLVTVVVVIVDFLQHQNFQFLRFQKVGVVVVVDEGTLMLVVVARYHHHLVLIVVYVQYDL